VCVRACPQSTLVHTSHTPFPSSSPCPKPHWCSITEVGAGRPSSWPGGALSSLTVILQYCPQRALKRERSPWRRHRSTADCLCCSSLPLVCVLSPRARAVFPGVREREIERGRERERVCVCVGVCVCVCVRERERERECVCVCMSVCLSVCLSVYMFVYVYV